MPFVYHGNFYRGQLNYSLRSSHHAVTHEYDQLQMLHLVVVFYAIPLYLNPAFAGTHICPRLNLNYRNQWPGISGTFVTYSASFDQHSEALHGGLGLLVVNDQAANSLKSTRVSGMYSYQLKVTRKFSVRL